MTRRYAGRRGALALLGLLAAATIVAPWPAPSAGASCAGPQLELVVPEPIDDSRPPNLRAGSEITVEGQHFVDGCDDTGSATVFGCDADEGEVETPMHDIDLVLERGGRMWVLGTADAGGADDDRLGQVTWTVELPQDVEGPATLTAATSEPLPVSLVLREPR